MNVLLGFLVGVGVGMVGAWAWDRARWRRLVRRFRQLPAEASRKVSPG